MTKESLIILIKINEALAKIDALAELLSDDDCEQYNKRVIELVTKKTSNLFKELSNYEEMLNSVLSRHQETLDSE